MAIMLMKNNTYNAMIINIYYAEEVLLNVTCIFRRINIC
jgi:hypothetical protein